MANCSHIILYVIGEKPENERVWKISCRDSMTPHGFEDWTKDGKNSPAKVGFQPRVHVAPCAILTPIHRPVISHDAKSFLRPDDFAGGDVPAKTARATQSLRLGQIGIAS